MNLDTDYEFFHNYFRMGGIERRHILRLFATTTVETALLNRKGIWQRLPRGQAQLINGPSAAESRRIFGEDFPTVQYPEPPPSPAPDKLHKIFLTESEYEEPYVELRGNIVETFRDNRFVDGTKLVIRATNAPWNFTAIVYDEKMDSVSGKSNISELAKEAKKSGREVQFKVIVGDDPEWREDYDLYARRPENNISTEDRAAFEVALPASNLAHFIENQVDVYFGGFSRQLSLV